MGDVAATPTAGTAQYPIPIGAAPGLGHSANTVQKTRIPRKGGNHEVAYFMTWLTAVLRKEEGQGLAEYALILALIAVVAILALVFLGTRISSILSQIGVNI